MSRVLLHPAEAEIHPIDEPDCTRRVELWAIRGLARSLWPTKLAAEAAARAVWPQESPDERYARISFIRFVQED